MNVNFKLRGNPELEEKLEQLPYGYKRVALEAFTDYTIGDERHGLKWYPEPRGQTYVRKYNLRNGWGVKDTQGGYRPVIYNDIPYAPHVPNMWGRGGRIDYGWRQYADIIKSNFNGAIRHARAAVNAWLNDKFG